MSSLRTSHVPKDIANAVFGPRKDESMTADVSVTLTSADVPILREAAAEFERRAGARAAIDSADPDALYPLPPSPVSDFEPAPDLEALYELLMEEFDSALIDELAWHVGDARIRFAWKAKGGSSQGRATLGKCVKLSGATRYFAKQADYLIWIAWDHVRNFKLTNHQMAALLFHELSHINKVVDEDSGDISYGVKGHEIEAFNAEVQLFGAWFEDLERAAETFQQLGLEVEA